jgi:hypothetical protein
MAGYSKLYVIGGLGGFQGADGVNPIDLQILVGDADRQWLEARYFDKRLKPLGKVRAIIPAAPNDPEALLDAAIAFYPKHFATCPSLHAIESSLGEQLNIWRANLVKVCQCALPLSNKAIASVRLSTRRTWRVWPVRLKRKRPLHKFADQMDAGRFRRLEARSDRAPGQRVSDNRR